MTGPWNCQARLVTGRRRRSADALWRRATLGIACGLLASGAALSDPQLLRNIPPVPATTPSLLPPPRPSDLGAQPPASRDSRVVPPGQGPDRACLDALRLTGAKAESVPQPSSDNACAVDDPVRLVSIVSNGRPIALPDRPILACGFALTIADWLGRLAAPALGTARRTAVIAVTTGPGDECRFRNRAASGPLSAHAKGLALDVSAFRFEDGTSLAVAQASDDAAFKGVRASACELFTTVLGPGSDAFHNDHLHLDLQPHGREGRYRICS